MLRRFLRPLWPLSGAGLAFLALACADPSVVGSVEEEDGISCTIPQSQIFSGGPGKDGIPALTNPTFVGVGDEGTEYLLGSDRVVGFFRDSEPYAIPLNIFWWHEIVNLDLGGQPISVTHCPLTGSSLAFDRGAAGGAEFGVSGLLYQNNLIMYDRSNPESLWPQMLRGARCGDRSGTDLTMVPVQEMNWARWQTLHPGTKVVSSDTQSGRNYEQYPYGTYDVVDNSQVLFPQSVDDRRPPKERVLGIPSGSGGVALPYGVLDELGPVAAVAVELDGEDLVVFWDRSAQGAMAFRTQAGSQILTFSVEGGDIVDDQTGSTWRLDGRAVSGPLAGSELEPVAEAFVAFWFAWPAFYPQVQIWSAG